MSEVGGTITVDRRESVSSSGSRTQVRPVSLSGSARVFAIPESQLYYWTRHWQADEQVAVEELERGEGRRFETARDAVRWLLSSED